MSSGDAVRSVYTQTRRDGMAIYQEADRSWASEGSPDGQMKKRSCPSQKATRHSKTEITEIARGWRGHKWA